MNKRIKVHTSLIKLNGIRSELQDELEEFKNMRNSINDKQRTKLETRIGSREVMIKDLDFVELELRSKL